MKKVSSMTAIATILVVFTTGWSMATEPSGNTGEIDIIDSMKSISRLGLSSDLDKIQHFHDLLVSDFEKKLAPVLSDSIQQTEYTMREMVKLLTDIREILEFDMIEKRASVFHFDEWINHHQNRIFEWFDDDGDGMISRQEFNTLKERMTHQQISPEWNTVDRKNSAE